MVKVSYPLFKSYYNLNCIKDLSVILMFATPAGAHKCKKEHLECPNKSGNRQHPTKVLSSDFCVHVQSHIFKTV